MTYLRIGRDRFPKVNDTNPELIADFHVFARTPPPPDTWVWYKYDAIDIPQLGLVCKSLCCMSAHGFNLMLPTYWRLATPEEAAAEIAERAKPRTPITDDEIWDLYAKAITD